MIIDENMKNPGAIKSINELYMRSLLNELSLNKRNKEFMLKIMKVR